MKSKQPSKRDLLINELAEGQFYELFYWFGHEPEPLKDRANRLGIPYVVALLIDKRMEELRELML